jgi:hypothetical protein
LFCCVITQPVVAQGDSSPEALGYISIECGDLSIALSLDETSLGLCPVDSLPAAPGEYVLKGWPVEGRRFTSSFFSRRIVVRAGLETIVDLSDLRWIRLETDPFGALVTRGGVPLGRTPITLSVSKGDPPMLVEKDGYQIEPVSAQSLLSGPPTRRIDLVPVPGQAPLPAVGFSEPVEKKRMGFKTVLMSMTVIGSATAAVALSKEADDAFEEYKTAGDRGRMNSLFDRAERLDTWSVASWIVSEVALGALLYHLLHNPDPAPSMEPGEARSMEAGSLETPSMKAGSVAPSGGAK